MFVTASSTTEVNDLRYQIFCVKMKRLSPVCYPHAEIVSSCTSFESTTRQQPGSAVCMLVPQCPTLPSVDGYMMMASSALTGYGRHQLHMLSWNRLLATVCVPVSCRNVHVCLANIHACRDVCKLQ